MLKTGDELKRPNTSIKALVAELRRLSSPVRAEAAPATAQTTPRTSNASSEEPDLRRWRGSPPEWRECPMV